MPSDGSPSGSAYVISNRGEGGGIKEATYLSMEHITEGIQAEAEAAAHVGSALISYCFLSGCARFPSCLGLILEKHTSEWTTFRASRRKVEPERYPCQ